MFLAAAMAALTLTVHPPIARLYCCSHLNTAVLSPQSGSFGVSAGLEQSGGAAAIANLIVSIGKSAGGGNFTIAAV